MKPYPRSRRPRTLADCKAVARRRSPILFVCALALSAGATAAVLLARPTYESELKLLVRQDRTDSAVTPTPNADTSRGVLTENDVLSQVELIKSTDLLERVATESGLTSRLLTSGDAQDEAQAVALATDDLRDDLDVSPIKRTWLIDVSYRAEDRRTARHVLDTLARLYLEKHLTLHRPVRHLQLLHHPERAGQARAPGRAGKLVDYGRTNGVISASIERESILQKFVEFDGLRAQAAAAHLESSQRLSAVRSELESVPAQHVSEVKTSDDRGVTRDIRARILGLEARRTELLQKFTPTYRGVIEVEDQLRDARAALARAQDAPLKEETLAANPAREWLDTEQARVVADNAGGGSSHAVLRGHRQPVPKPRAAARGAQRRRARARARRCRPQKQKYLLYLQKAEEARISDELDRTRIANVVVAQAPTVDYEAKRNPSLAMLPVLLGISMLLSFAVAVAVDIRDPAVRYGITRSAADVSTTPRTAPEHGGSILHRMTRASTCRRRRRPTAGAEACRPPQRFSRSARTRHVRRLTPDLGPVPAFAFSRPVTAVRAIAAADATMMTAGLLFALTAGMTTWPGSVREVLALSISLGHCIQLAGFAAAALAVFWAAGLYDATRVRRQSVEIARIMLATTAVAAVAPLILTAEHAFALDRLSVPMFWTASTAAVIAAR